MDHELVLTPLNDLCLNGLKNLLPSFPSPVAATDSDCKCDQMQAESNAQLSPTQANSSIGHSRKASSMGEYPSTVDTRVGVAGAGGRESFGDGSTLVPLSWQPPGASGNTGHPSMSGGSGGSSSDTGGDFGAGGTGGIGGSGGSGDGAVQTTAAVLEHMPGQPSPSKRPRVAVLQSVGGGSPKVKRSEGEDEDAPTRAQSPIFAAVNEVKVSILEYI